MENAGIEELELGLGARLAALLHQPFIGVRRLWILVQTLHVGVGGCGIQVEVVFLDILAVVALIAGQAE